MDFKKIQISAQIPDRLHIMVSYISFYVFKKNQILAPNPKRAFGFTEKCSFAVKTDRTFIFLCCKAHIPDRLHVMAPYIIFMGFKKLQISAQNPKWPSGFTKKNTNL
jgi:hypothetical protein